MKLSLHCYLTWINNTYFTLYYSTGNILLYWRLFLHCLFFCESVCVCVIYSSIMWSPLWPTRGFSHMIVLFPILKCAHLYCTRQSASNSLSLSIFPSISHTFTSNRIKFPSQFVVYMSSYKMIYVIRVSFSFFPFFSSPVKSLCVHSRFHLYRHLTTISIIKPTHGDMSQNECSRKKEKCV